MLDIQFIIENKEIVRKSIKDRNMKDVDLDNLEMLYKKRLELIKDVDEINRQKKVAANDRNEEEGKRLKGESSTKEEELAKVNKELTAILSVIPNILSPDVPIGKDDSENKVLKKVGEARSFSFTPKPNWELGEDLDVVDSKRAAKVTGSRFSYIKGDLAKVQFAILQFVLDKVTDPDFISEIIDKNNLQIKKTPFIPIIPPIMIKPEALNAMGRLDPKEDKFFLQTDNLYLVGSCEHSIGSMYMGESIKEEDLPIRYIGYSTALRREAGSYGKDTRGMLRQHQFDKAEFEIFSTPETSREEHELLVALQEYFVASLGLPYQLVANCTGDTALPNYSQKDIEVYMPGQKAYRETHSADYMTGYQARRMNTKVIREDGKKEILHTNDATAFAMGRILISIMENNQNEDGTIDVPTVLQKYCGIEKIKKTP